MLNNLYWNLSLIKFAKLILTMWCPLASDYLICLYLQMISPQIRQHIFFLIFNLLFPRNSNAIQKPKRKSFEISITPANTLKLIWCLKHSLAAVSRAIFSLSKIFFFFFFFNPPKPNIFTKSINLS